MDLELEGFIELLGLSFDKVSLGMGLTFVNKDLNMAAINFFSLQNLQYLEIKNNYTGHFPKLVFGNFYVVTRFN